MFPCSRGSGNWKRPYLDALGLWSFMWLESDVGWGCAHQKAYLRLENLIWRWVSHVAVDRRLGSLLCGPSHGWLECPYNMAGSFPQNEGWEIEREESFHASYNLLTHCEFSILYLLEVSPWDFPGGLVVGTLFPVQGVHGIPGWGAKIPHASHSLT